MILVVAATERELASADGAATLCCGIGPVEAALAPRLRFARERPDAVLHVGIAGAPALGPGSVVIGTEASTATSWIRPRRSARVERVLPAGALVEAARRAAGRARSSDRDVCGVGGGSAWRCRGDGGLLGSACGRARGCARREVRRSPTVRRTRTRALADRGCSCAVGSRSSAARRGNARVRALRFGFTPCPERCVRLSRARPRSRRARSEVEPVLLDIEELNRRARRWLELTKLSFGAAPAVDDRYRLLRSGAALGNGVGPLVVARAAAGLEEAVSGRVAIPRLETTAFLLLRLAAPDLGEVVELRYDRILDAVSRGEVDAGLIIHESRFTYRDHGLVRSRILATGGKGDRDCPSRSRGSAPRRPCPRRRSRPLRPPSAPRSSTRLRIAMPAGSTCVRTRASCRRRSAARTSSCT